MELEQLQRAIEAILFTAGERVEIARMAQVLQQDPADIRQAAALRAGGHGDRYTICVGGRSSCLYFERSLQRSGNYIGRWFVERKQG